jgi:hypothetical protein
MERIAEVKAGAGVVEGPEKRFLRFILVTSIQK